MRPSQGYKIVGALIIAPSAFAVIQGLIGQTPGEAPGAGVAIIGFLIYRRGITLALRERESASSSAPPSGHLAMLAILARQLKDTVLRRK